jgi:membrane-associated protease RseP (regulator of RpoE activity)
MSDLSGSDEKHPEAFSDTSMFDTAQPLVASEFDVEEALVEHGVPTFYVRLKPDTKQAFIRLIGKLSLAGLTPALRELEGRRVIKVAHKPQVKPSRPIINVILLLATIATVFVTGYFLSLGSEEFGLDPWLGAAGFTLALLGILGAHEMAHKFAANRHGMAASLPYFIPGPPFLGIGTFGAVIVQKETAPNRDALFDIGASGPVLGFVVTVVVSAIGLLMSHVEAVTEPFTGGGLPISPLFLLLMNALVRTPGPGDYVVYLHPVAFAGWLGMFVTLLNLLPTGMLDGGHTLRSIINNDFARAIFTAVSVLLLLVVQQYLMLALVLFLSMYKHPGPLDDVSPLSWKRRLLAVLLVVIFILCLFIF